jgi:hypothetical protein
MPFNADSPKRIPGSRGSADPGQGAQRVREGCGVTGGTPGVTGRVGRSLGVGLAVEVDVGLGVVEAGRLPVGGTDSAGGDVTGRGNVVPGDVGPVPGLTKRGGTAVPVVGVCSLEVEPMPPVPRTPVGIGDPEPTTAEGRTGEEEPLPGTKSIVGAPPPSSERTATTENAVPATANAWSALRTLRGSWGAR